MKMKNNIEELELSLDVYDVLKQWANTNIVKIKGTEYNIEDLPYYPLYTLTEEEINHIIYQIDHITYHLPIEVKESIINNIKLMVT